MAGLDPKARVNLSKATVLLIDGNPSGMTILKQVMAGFGVRRPHCCANVEEAKELIQTDEVNLIVSNDLLPDGTGYDFVHWLRRSDLQPNAFTPVIIVSGHTKRANVAAARDCGANFIVAKPFSPLVLLERTVWVALEARPYVDTGNYLGPDRRFHDADKVEQARRKGDAERATAAAPADPADDAEQDSGLEAAEAAMVMGAPRSARS